MIVVVAGVSKSLFRLRSPSRAYQANHARRFLQFPHFVPAPASFSLPPFLPPHFPPHTPRPIGSCPRLSQAPPMSDVSCLSSTSPFPKIKRPPAKQKRRIRAAQKNSRQFRRDDCVRAAEETPNSASLIPFPSLAGQMAIVHQAVLLAPVHHSPAPSQGIRPSDSRSIDK